MKTDKKKIEKERLDIYNAIKHEIHKRIKDGEVNSYCRS